jgi:DNA primase
MDKGLVYLLDKRHITEEEISDWHILTSEDSIQIPVLDFTGKYIFTIKKLFSDGGMRWDYPSDAPTAFNVFGLDRALVPILQRGYAIVVEGPLDVIAMHYVGFTNTIGAMSNNLTRWQGLLLRRWTDKLLLLFDGDDGGREGSAKTQELLLDPELRLQFNVLTIGLAAGDPDDIVRATDIKAGERLQSFKMKLQNRAERWMQECTGIPYI